MKTIILKILKNIPFYLSLASLIAFIYSFTFLYFTDIDYENINQLEKYQTLDILLPYTNIAFLLFATLHLIIKKS